MSYRSDKYPDSLDFSALNDLIKGDVPTKAKAEYHVQGFLFGRILGEPAPAVASASLDDGTTEFAVAPVVIHEAEVDAAVPFTEDELKLADHVVGDPITDVIIIVRIVATLRKYAPAFYNFIRQYIVAK